MTFESVFFDVIILFFLSSAGTALYLWLARKARPLPRLVRWPVTILLSLGWIIIFYGSFIEPRLIASTRQTIHLGNSGTYVRIAVLSDLHAGPYKGEGFFRRVLNKVKLENPDMVVFLGDYIYNKPEAISDLKPFAELYARSGKYLGSYGVLGNHEYGLPDSGQTLPIDEEKLAQVKVSLQQQAQITLLNNDHLPFWVGNKRFYLIGIEDLWSGRASFTKDALHGLSPSIPKILLSHNPDVTLLAPHLADLIIAGHTHGGQIALPWIGPIPQVPTELGRRFARGLFTINNTLTFITSGLGESGPRARLFVPPEIGILNIEL